MGTYANTIRTASINANDVADLIEGIFTSSFDGTQFGTWSPTYSASGSLTFTSVSTDLARYCRIGKLVFFTIRATGTTGGTASSDIYFTLPVTALGLDVGLPFAASFDNGTGTSTVGTGLIQSTTLGLVGRDDRSNWGLGASRQIRAQGFYEAA